MLYASTMEQLKRALNLSFFIHAGSEDEVEWETVLKAVSRT
jgi:cofilin